MQIITSLLIEQTKLTNEDTENSLYNIKTVTLKSIFFFELLIKNDPQFSFVPFQPRQMKNYLYLRPKGQHNIT